MASNVSIGLAIRNQSSGLGLGALLALAPSVAMPLFAASDGLADVLLPRVQVTVDHSSSVSSAVATPLNLADEALRREAAAAFDDLLKHQTDIEPDIAAVLYANRSSLYAAF